MVRTTVHSPETPAASAAPASTFPTLHELIASEKASRHPAPKSALSEGQHRQCAPPAVPLALEARATLDTATAAYHLSRQPQTLRTWACLENGPIRPVRVNGRLAWPTDAIRRLLGVQQ